MVWFQYCILSIQWRECRASNLQSNGGAANHRHQSDSGGLSKSPLGAGRYLVKHPPHPRRPRAGDLRRIRQAASSANCAIGGALRPELQRLEGRVLLSGYTLSQLGLFGENATGASPTSSLVADSAGDFFGAAGAGGTYGVGTVFEIPKGSNAVTAIAWFTGSNGSEPNGLAMDGAGNLFGTTRIGGANGDGTVFEIPAGSATITTLATFTGANGSQPDSALTLDGSGDLYGTTYVGGANNDGSVFEIANGSTSISTVASFNGTNGLIPEGGVALDASGNLYGTTYEGGASSDGTVFEIASGSATITTVVTFNGSNGSGPLAGVTLDGSGNVYGTTYAGGSTLFEIGSGSGTLTTLASFGAYELRAAVVLDASGNLYGTTVSGGASADGTVFELATGSSTITTLCTFDGTNGRYPSAVSLDGAGNLYGVTSAGGTAGEGTAFEIAQGSSAVSTVATFSGLNGSGPHSAPALDASGNLYGTTYAGGAAGVGAVFGIAKGSGVATTIASFNGANGSRPSAGVTLDASGDLFGTTSLGGAYNDGTVFEILEGSSAITTLASFNQTDGSSPAAAVTLDPAGNIYGMTVFGGVDNDGTVFEIAAGSNALTTIASFNGADGADPTGAPVMDASGNLYGTTGASTAVNTYGGVFEIALGSNAITTLASFNSTNGRDPQGVTFDASGNLYGTTKNGGPGSMGTVFELAKGSGNITTLASFGAASGGWEPRVGLTIDVAGNLYGTTPGGGSAFELPKGSATLTALVTFNGTNGSNPLAGLTLDASGNLYGTTSGGGPDDSGTVFELTTNSAIALTLTGGSNPCTYSQRLSYTAAVTGGVPDGEAVSLLDTSNGNKMIATGTLSNRSATLTVPAGTLLAGTHNLIASYGGDASFAASQSAPYAQIVQVGIMSVTVNGNLPSLVGVQRSMVDSIVYSFSEAVNLTAANAFSISVHAGQGGTLPTALTWTALNANSDGSSTQWAVAFSGAGVSGGSIADGVYDITLNAAAVTSDANSSVTVQPRAADTFYRLFGDTQGTGKVTTADYTAFLSTYGLKSTDPAYLGYFADDGTTKIDNADYNVFLGNYGKKLSGFMATI